MIIGIDGNEANIKNRVGVNKYAYEIIKGIYKLSSQKNDPVVYVYLKSKPLDDMPKENNQFKYIVLSGGKIWIITKLMPHLLTNPEKLDVFFTPSHYLPPFTTMPRVCAIMDLGYLKFSDQFRKYDYWQLKYWTAWSVKISKYILTISNATSKDIVRLSPASKDKVVVTHPGVDANLTTGKISATQIQEVKKKYSIVSDYILYIGTLKPSKNIEGLLRAFHALKFQILNFKFQIVIAGKKGWLYNSIFELAKQLDLEQDVIFTDFVEEKDKAALIKGARIFVLPSFWEGFGIDILTAFALGVPVVASNVGSIPEVVGDAGILINPKNPNSIALGMKKVLNMDKPALDNLRKKAYNRLKSFSWEKSAQLTMETLRKAAE